LRSKNMQQRERDYMNFRSKLKEDIAKLAKASKKMFHLWTMIVSALVILVTIIIAAFYVAAFLRGEAYVEASGRSNIDFRVFYLENEIFAENPVPQNLSFLMSFTDYIEFENSFSATFSAETDIDYSYTATKQLVIRHMGTIDGNFNPVVFEHTTILSEASGSTHAQALNFTSDDASTPGGTYIVSPREHIDIYLEFILAHEAQMQAENISEVGFRGFSAELLIDFTHQVNARSFGINETLTSGYRFSLSSEVYSFDITGISDFETFVTVATAPDITLPMIMAFVLILTASTIKIFQSIKNMALDPNENRRAAKGILKKYSNEIIVTKNMWDLSAFNLMFVEEFEELIKLSINLNKHIMCYMDDNNARFCTLVDNNAFYFSLTFCEGEAENHLSGLTDENETTVFNNSEDKI